MTTTIAISDPARLAALEARAEPLRDAAHEFWAILSEIKESGVYRDVNKSWSEYVKARWGIGQSHAYRQLAAAKVEKQLSPMGEKVRPKNERAARAIAAAPAEVVEEAVRIAKEEADGETVEVSTATIAKATAKVAKPVKAPERPRDGAGRVIRDSKVAAAIEQAQRFREIALALHAIKRDVLALAEEEIGHELPVGRIKDDILNAIKGVEFAAPFATCPMASNCGPRCKSCGGHKWVSKSKWEAIPKDVRGDA